MCVRRPLSRVAWFLSSLCRNRSRFGRRINHRWQFQLGLFRLATVATVQRPDARSFFFDTQLSVSPFFALVLKVCRNRFCCHGQSVAELARYKLSNLALKWRFRFSNWSN